MKVLVADDVEAMRVSLQLALESAGHQVSCASSGNAALGALRIGGFDAAILDLWMPEGDGLTVLRQIRAEQPGLLIFIITGGGPKMPLEAAALLSQVWGAQEVFVKPFDEADLVAALAAGHRHE